MAAEKHRLALGAKRFQHLDDVARVLPGERGHVEVVVLLEHVDGLVCPPEEGGEGKVGGLGVGDARGGEEERAGGGRGFERA